MQALSEITQCRAELLAQARALGEFGGATVMLAWLRRFGVQLVSEMTDAQLATVIAESAALEVA